MKKSACLPLWVSGWLMMAIGLAAVGGMSSSVLVASPRGLAFDHGTKAEPGIAKSDAKPGTRKMTCTPRLLAIGAGTTVDAAPKMVRGGSISAARGEYFAAVLASASRERAPPV